MATEDTDELAQLLANLLKKDDAKTPPQDQQLTSPNKPINPEEIITDEEANHNTRVSTIGFINANTKSPYAALNIAEYSNPDAVKTAYKTLALAFHPDKNRHNPSEAESKFKVVSAAYELLSDPAKKAIADETLKHLDYYKKYLQAEKKLSAFNETLQSLGSEAILSNNDAFTLFNNLEVIENILNSAKPSKSFTPEQAAELDRLVEECETLNTKIHDAPSDEAVSDLDDLLDEMSADSNDDVALDDEAKTAYRTPLLNFIKTHGTPYEILNIATAATAEQIEAAYAALPAKNEQTTTAYQYLTDPIKRSVVDETLAHLDFYKQWHAFYLQYAEILIRSGGNDNSLAGIVEQKLQSIEEIFSAAEKGKQFDASQILTLENLISTAKSILDTVKKLDQQQLEIFSSKLSNGDNISAAQVLQIVDQIQTIHRLSNPNDDEDGFNLLDAIPDSDEDDDFDPLAVIINDNYDPQATAAAEPVVEPNDPLLAMLASLQEDPANPSAEATATAVDPAASKPQFTTGKTSVSNIDELYKMLKASLAITKFKDKYEDMLAARPYVDSLLVEIQQQLEKLGNPKELTQQFALLQKAIKAGYEKGSAFGASPVDKLAHQLYVLAQWKKVLPIVNDVYQKYGADPTKLASNYAQIAEDMKSLPLLSYSDDEIAAFKKELAKVEADSSKQKAAIGKEIKELEERCKHPEQYSAAEITKFKADIERLNKTQGEVPKRAVQLHRIIDRVANKKDTNAANATNLALNRVEEQLKRLSELNAKDSPQEFKESANKIYSALLKLREQHEDNALSVDRIEPLIKQLQTTLATGKSQLSKRSFLERLIDSGRHPVDELKKFVDTTILKKVTDRQELRTDIGSMQAGIKALPALNPATAREKAQEAGQGNQVRYIADVESLRIHVAALQKVQVTQSGEYLKFAQQISELVKQLTQLRVKYPEDKTIPQLIRQTQTTLEEAQQTFQQTRTASEKLTDVLRNPLAEINKAVKVGIKHEKTPKREALEKVEENIDQLRRAAPAA